VVRRRRFGLYGGFEVCPVSGVASAQGGVVERETTLSKEAYARFPEAKPISFSEEFLPPH
jgi:hypothetical protein